MNKAKIKATEGGYITGNKSDAEMLIDPKFFQALGKAEGWGTEMTMIDEKGHPKEWCYFNHCSVCGKVVTGEEEYCPNECETENAPIVSWIYQWHNFIDHLAEGKDVNSFFDNLLK